LREQTQVEISRTDGFGLGVTPPVKLSGNLSGSIGVTLRGPAGQIDLNEGLILAQRHIHCGPVEAKKLKLKNGCTVSVRISGERGVVFDNIPVRVRSDDRICLHLDTDEGNAAGINKTGEGLLIIK